MPRAALSDHQLESQREQICGVATRLFATRGYEGMTMRGLAADLGCSPMTPYRYYKDKAAIFDAVRTAAFGRFAGCQERAAAACADPLQRLMLLGEAYLRFALDEPAAYRIMFELDQPEAVPQAQLADEEARAWAVLRGCVVDALDARVIRGDADTTAQLFWGGLHGLVALQLAGKLRMGRDVTALSAAMMRLLIDGARSSLPAEVSP